MPLLLKKDSVRMLQASVETFNLALIGLSLPRRIERDISALTAPPVGMLGAAVELAMSAIIVQVYGQRALMLNTTQFKSGAEILELFRRILRSTIPRTSFITQGITNPTDHINELYKPVFDSQ